VNAMRLPSNQLHHFYRGGEAIARFRGVAFDDEYAPEDWVGSTAAMLGQDGRGLSTLPDGRLLRDAIAADAEGFLGRAHTARYGADPGLLVKLLDAGERLPVHAHPDRAFARRHLGLDHGKTEAWLIVETRAARATVRLGFCRDVDHGTLAGWVELQDSESMLEALNELEVEPGDCVFVPAGVPHAIGEGIFLVELQEPSDLSVLLEWSGFEVDGARDGHLGLGFDLALGCVRETAVGADELARLIRKMAVVPESAPGIRSLLPPDASAFFRAERLQPRPAVSLEPAFAILVVVDGDGQLETEDGGILRLSRGDTALVPYAAGSTELTGRVDAIRCLPPLPEDDE
jgi:mannose-6-phosphate isomerase